MTPETRPDDPGSPADPRAHACARPSCGDLPPDLPTLASLGVEKLGFSIQQDGAAAADYLRIGLSRRDGALLFSREALGRVSPGWGGLLLPPETAVGVAPNAHADPFDALRVVNGLPRALPGFRCDGGIRWPRHRIGPSLYATGLRRLADREYAISVNITRQGALIEFAIALAGETVLVDLAAPATLDDRIGAALDCLYGVRGWVMLPTSGPRAPAWESDPPDVGSDA